MVFAGIVHYPSTLNNAAQWGTAKEQRELGLQSQAPLGFGGVMFTPLPPNPSYPACKTGMIIVITSCLSWLGLQ